MNRNKPVKYLLAVLFAAVLFAAAAVSAGAVPARPGAGHTGESAACRSHHGALVTLADIPARQGDSARAPSIDPVKKDIPLLTVVIGFTNVPYENGWDWSETIFSGEKSLSAYYSDMSFGKFTFTPAAETSAFGVGGNTNAADKANDGVVHVNVPMEHKDWANKDEDPALAQAMIAAIEAADEYVDFSAFDCDENGFIAQNELAVGFVFAGYEGSASSTYELGVEKYLWAHAWSIGSIIWGNHLDLSVPTPDGTAVDAYIAIAENLDDNVQEPISVLAHELGHYLGLPDLYDTSNNTGAEWGEYAVDDYSVMAGGSWGIDPAGGYVPYSMDVWSRCALGWCTPQTAETDGTYTVAAQSYAPTEAFNAVYIPTERPDEYYLLENRQYVKWDAGLAYFHDAAGIIVWHIDDDVYEQYNGRNQVNDTFHRPAVMPLFPEKNENEYTFIGNTAEVLIDSAFYGASAWEALFGENADPLDLPLYGEGEDADLRAARTLSGIKADFLTDSAAVMTVRLSLPYPHDHVLSAVSGTAPTCTEPGTAAHWECTVCGALFADPECAVPVTAESLFIPATGHSFTYYVYNYDATCTADGTETAFCAYGCGEADTRTAAGTKRTHVFADYAYDNNATCTADGTETAFCAYGCGEADTRTAAGTKLAHIFADYAYDNNATCTADGTETAFCAYGCGETDTRVVAGTKLPHAYGEPVWRWRPDYGCAAATFTCVCGDTRTVYDTAPAETEVSAATQTQDRVATFTARVIFGGAEYSVTAENVLLPGTATGGPGQPDDPPQSGSPCPLDGKDHGGSVWGKLLLFFHRCLFLFKRGFGTF